MLNTVDTPLAQDLHILIERLRQLSKADRMWEIERFLVRLQEQPSEHILSLHQRARQAIQDLEQEGLTGRHRFHEHSQRYGLLKDLYGPLTLIKDRLLLPDL